MKTSAREGGIDINQLTNNRVLGAVAAVIGLVLLFKYFGSTYNPEDRVSSTSTETVAESEKPDLTNGSGIYLVKPGDNLWNIAENNYGSGYAWVDIYQANREIIKSPDKIEAGWKLELPKVAKYVVESGDTLWDISEQFCQSGYAWTSIAKTNALANPRLIYPGQELKIICP